METRTFLFAVKRTVARIFGGSGGAMSRASWCRSQRRQLDGARGAVLWVRGEAVPWAAWGARHGYFEVQYMDGLPYLSALATPAT
jgi:hypothetical protein